MNENTIQETTSNNDKITKPNRQADVLDQTRLRPQCNEAKIISLLLNLKNLGKADLTMKFVSDRPERASIFRKASASCCIFPLKKQLLQQRLERLSIP